MTINNKRKSPATSTTEAVAASYYASEETIEDASVDSGAVNYYISGCDDMIDAPSFLDSAGAQSYYVGRVNVLESDAMPAPTGAESYYTFGCKKLKEVDAAALLDTTVPEIYCGMVDVSSGAQSYYVGCADVPESDSMSAPTGAESYYTIDCETLKEEDSASLLDTTIAESSVMVDSVGAQSYYIGHVDVLESDSMPALTGAENYYTLGCGALKGKDASALLDTSGADSSHVVDMAKLVDAPVLLHPTGAESYYANACEMEVGAASLADPTGAVSYYVSEEVTANSASLLDRTERGADSHYTETLAKTRAKPSALNIMDKVFKEQCITPPCADSRRGFRFSKNFRSRRLSVTGAEAYYTSQAMTGAEANNISDCEVNVPKIVDSFSGITGAEAYYGRSTSFREHFMREWNGVSTH